MTKLCPRGKAAAKRKFAVYPSAYANAYASKICAGKIKDPSGKKRKDFRGPKPAKAEGGRIYKANGGEVFKIRGIPKGAPEGVKRQIKMGNAQVRKYKEMGIKNFEDLKKARDEGRISRPLKKTKFKATGGRVRAAGGGLMEATQRLRRQGLKRGGGVCLRGMNREAIGKNS